jgi:hypothetical protein
VNNTISQRNRERTKAIIDMSMADYQIDVIGFQLYFHKSYNSILAEKGSTTLTAIILYVRKLRMNVCFAQCHTLTIKKAVNFARHGSTLCNLSYSEGRDRKITDQGQTGQKCRTGSKKQTKAKELLE